MEPNETKNHFKYWYIRRAIAVLAIIISAFTANSFNTSLITIWVLGVVLPIVYLLLTSNDGDEIELFWSWLKDGYLKITRR